MSHRKMIDDALAAGEVPPIEGASSLSDYEQRVLEQARSAYAAASPEEQAAHPLDIPYLKHLAGRMFRLHHGGGPA